MTWRFAVWLGATYVCVIMGTACRDGKREGGNETTADASDRGECPSLRSDPWEVPCEPGLSCLVEDTRCQEGEQTRIDCVGGDTWEVEAICEASNADGGDESQRCPASFDEIGEPCVDTGQMCRFEPSDVDSRDCQLYWDVSCTFGIWVAYCVHIDGVLPSPDACDGGDCYDAGPGAAGICRDGFDPGGGAACEVDSGGMDASSSG